MAQVLEREYEGVGAPPVGTYTLDPAHTAIGFVAKHMMFTKVRGHFARFDGAIVVGETPQDSSVHVTMEADSLTTGVHARDQHLRSRDFFEIERYPQLSFRSTKVEWTGGNTLRVTGDLTVRDVTRPVVLEAEYEGATPDPWGGFRVAFTARGEIDREDWGITWNVALETGGVLVSKKVTLEIETQAVLQQAPAEPAEEGLARAS
jgi:polyisoprenoid-binding protein YceI